MYSLLNCSCCSVPLQAPISRVLPFAWSPSHGLEVEEELLPFVFGVEESLLGRCGLLTAEGEDGLAQRLAQPGHLLHPHTAHPATFVHAETVAAAADEEGGVGWLYGTALRERPADPPRSTYEAMRGARDQLRGRAEEDKVAEAVVMVCAEAERCGPRPRLLMGEDGLVDEGWVVDVTMLEGSVEAPLEVGGRRAVAVVIGVARVVGARLEEDGHVVPQVGRHRVGRAAGMRRRLYTRGWLRRRRQRCEIPPPLCMLTKLGGRFAGRTQEEGAAGQLRLPRRLTNGRGVIGERHRRHSRRQGCRARHAPVGLGGVSVVVEGALAVFGAVGGDLTPEDSRACSSAVCRRLATLHAGLAAKGAVEVDEKGVDAVLARVDVRGHVQWLGERDGVVDGARGPRRTVSSSMRSESWPTPRWFGKGVELSSSASAEVLGSCLGDRRDCWLVVWQRRESICREVVHSGHRAVERAEDVELQRHDGSRWLKPVVLGGVAERRSRRSRAAGVAFTRCLEKRGGEWRRGVFQSGG